MADETPGELTFSQRMGLSPLRKALQIDSMDEALKNGLWNVVLEFLCDPLCEVPWFYECHSQLLIKWIWSEYFDRPMDRLPDKTREIANSFRGYFYTTEWNRVYDFLQF